MTIVLLFCHSRELQQSVRNLTFSICIMFFLSDRSIMRNISSLASLVKFMRYKEVLDFCVMYLCVMFLSHYGNLLIL